MDPENNDTRPALRTPRFVFGSSNPSAGSSAPRFAATPRFLFGERKQQEDLPGDEIDSDIGPQSTSDHSEPGSIHGDDHQSTQSRLEIPDSDDDGELSLPGSNPPLYDDYMGGDDMEVEDLEDEYNSLFSPSPTRPKAKRRRLSLSPTRTLQPRRSGGAGIDQIASSPLSDTSQNLLQSDTSLEQLHDNIASPPARLPASTPLAAGSSSQFPPPSSRYPRFVLDPNSPAPSRPPEAIAASQPSATTPQRKRHFVLPITPSRRIENESTVSPRVNPLFSPTTRPGRSSRGRSTTKDYTPGGMASEVRNWIFELNATKHVSQYPSSQYPQTQQSQLISTQAGVASTQNHALPSERHHVVAEILDVTTTVPSLSGQRSRLTGPGHVAPTTLVLTSAQHPEPVPSCRKILLFGAPISSPAQPQDRRASAEAGLKKDDKVGIRKGVVWDMEISRVDSSSLEHTDKAREAESEKWLVGLEWDILSHSSI